MIKLSYLNLSWLILVFQLFSCQSKQEDFYRLSRADYLDKMKAAWVGQMAGVGWGAPTEFKYVDAIIPADQIPAWKPEMVNQFHQDDIYVEMTFLSSLEQYGPDVTYDQAGIDFANTGYMLWAANRQGRENLRSGIAPPASSHPEVNSNADDIDYQIEADFSGIIAPGMLQVPVELGEKFGRIMNYGDGMYGGQFVGGMYAAAFFENDINKIIEAGLSCIPEQSLYAKVVRDVINWHQQYPENWEKTWQLLEDKYVNSKENQPFAAQNEKVWIPIDAKVNGAYIVMGLLYGNGDLDRTIEISMRCGKDSDCNPSNAAGVLFTTIGFDQLPERFTRALQPQEVFSHTEYSFERLLEVCEELTRNYIIRSGGRVEEEKGEVVFYIPRKEVIPSELQQSWNPEPYQEKRFNEQQLQKIEAYPNQAFEEIMQEFAPQFTVSFCGKKAAPELLKSFRGKDNVLVTSPMNAQRGVMIRLKNRIERQPGERTWLNFAAGHQPDQRWKLKVSVNYYTVLTEMIGPETTKEGWKDFRIDVSEFTDSNWFFLFMEAENVDQEVLSTNYWADVFFSEQ